MHHQIGKTDGLAPQAASSKLEPVATPLTMTTTGAPAPARAEALETRILFALQAPVSLAVGPNVNITRLLENQNEASIAIDRSDPGNLFMGSVNDTRGTGPLDDVDLDGDGAPDTAPFLRTGDVRGLIGARSEDGGATWTSGALDSVLTEGGAPVDQGVLPAACCDPSVAFDDFGNLFFTLINRELEEVQVGLSTDLGRSFEIVARFTSGLAEFGVVDQPTVVTGPNSVWVTFQRDDVIVASGARVLGLGELSTAPREGFNFLQEAPRSLDGNFGDIAIGPDGEVIVTYQTLRDDPDDFVNLEGPAEIFANFDPDGFGPETFGRRFKITDTNVGSFDVIPAQADRTIDAEAGLAYDRSGGPFNGRIWMVYTDEGRDDSSSDTEIYLRFSDDQGQTWSTRRQVNDEDFSQNSQFLPRIALDQTTGNIAITWHDTRIQNNISFGPNDETQFFGTVGVPTVGEAGVAFADNVQISNGFSDAHRARAVIEYGDYTGLDFHNNVFYPAWADNSNSTGDNPSGGVNSGSALATFDVYTARVVVTPNTPRPAELTPVGPGSPLKPQFNGKDTVTKGKVFKFQVRYESPNGVDIASLGDNDLLVTGPNGYNLFAKLVKAKLSRRGTVATGTYQAAAPGGQFDLGDNGLYSILLQAGSVSQLGGGTSTAAGLLDQFLVSSTRPAQSPALHAAAPASAPLQPASTKLGDADDDDDDNLAAVGL